MTPRTSRKDREGNLVDGKQMGGASSFKVSRSKKVRPPSPHWLFFPLLSLLLSRPLLLSLQLSSTRDVDWTLTNDVRVHPSIFPGEMSEWERWASPSPALVTKNRASSFRSAISCVYRALRGRIPLRYRWDLVGDDYLSWNWVKMPER